MLFRSVDDPAALEEALVQVLTSAEHRLQLARGAARQRERLPSWDTAVSRFIDVLDAIEQMTSR